MWHIQHGLESIVYAVDWNLARENVFSGAAWLGGAGGGGAEVIEQLRKPTALICSSRGAEKTAQAGGRAKRDEQLIAMVKACVSRGGTALIPADSSARVLELAYILEHAWRKDTRERGPLASAKLYLAGRSMSSTMRYARTMLEWMDDNISREFEAVQDSLRRANGDVGKDGGPFDFKYAKIVERKAQIQKLLSQDTDNVQTAGRVIVASDASMEWGFSKDLLKGLARDSRNVLILTDRPSVLSDRPTLAAAVYDWWGERRDGVSTEHVDGEDVEFVYGGGRELEVRDASRQALEGDELALYQQWLAQRRMQENVQGGAPGVMEAAGDAADDASSESDLESEESDGEQQGRVLNISATMGQARKAVSDEDLGVNILVKKKGTYDFDVDGRKGRDRMFPLAVRRRRADEFGEVIRPEEYLRAEEKGDEGNEAPREEGEGLGRKRKWDESGAKGVNKKPQRERASSEDGRREVDELDEVEDAEEEPTGPSRLVVSTEKVMVNLRLAFVDFSGLHDKRSLGMLIPLIRPRKLILVGGSGAETEALAEDCRKLLVGQEGGADVFTPGVRDVVDASVDTNAWTLRLADELVKKLRWQSVRGLGIVTVTGRLDSPSPTPAPDLPPSDPSTTPPTEDDKKSTQVATLQPAEAAASHRTHRALHVGDLRLADLRREMQAAGHSAEFRGEGTLLVDGAVAVRKTSTGRVEVAGVVGGRGRGTLYEVRRVIYRSLAVVGA